MKAGELISYLVNSKGGDRKTEIGEIVKVNPKTFLVRLGNRIIKRKKDRDLSQ